jgi:hypothetical protein
MNEPHLLLTAVADETDLIVGLEIGDDGNQSSRLRSKIEGTPPITRRSRPCGAPAVSSLPTGRR